MPRYAYSRRCPKADEVLKLRLRKARDNSPEPRLKQIKLALIATLILKRCVRFKEGVVNVRTAVNEKTEIFW